MFKVLCILTLSMTMVLSCRQRGDSSEGQSRAKGAKSLSSLDSTETDPSTSNTEPNRTQDVTSNGEGETNTNPPTDPIAHPSDNTGSVPDPVVVLPEPCVEGTMIEDKDAMLDLSINGHTYSNGFNDRKATDKWAQDRQILSSFIKNSCQVAMNKTPFKNGGTFTSTSKATRDAICQLKGYVAATDRYSFTSLKSPGNDTAVFYAIAKKGFESRAVSPNEILITMQCKGRIRDACTGEFINTKNVVCLP